jgi:hypothetical protein
MQKQVQQQVFSALIEEGIPWNKAEEAMKEVTGKEISFDKAMAIVKAVLRHGDPEDYRQR